MTQNQSIVGAEAVGVQINGDNNTVAIYAGASKLVLEQRHKLRGEPSNERELLITELRATDFVGRESDLVHLRQWLDSPQTISVRCVTGRAGTGKTRLAIELCEHAEFLNWVAGFARSDELRRFSEAQSLSDWRWSRPTLVVVDYAAASTDILRTWLEILARRVSGKADPPLRILLLERHADREFGWWADLTRQGGLSGRGPATLVDPIEPIPLLSLPEIQDRFTLLSQVIVTAAKLRGLTPVPQLPTLSNEPEFEQRLAEGTINNEPLYLIMAGLVAVTTGVPTALALSRTDLAHRVAEAERARLERLAESWELNPNLMTHLVACVTLEGGCNAEAAKRLVQDEQKAMGYPVTVPVIDIVRKLADALPTIEPSMGIDVVRPNMIGEAFLLQELRRDRRPLTEQLEIVERAWRRTGVHVVVSIIRTIQDHAGVDASHVSLAWLDHLISLSKSLDDLIAISDEFPLQTTLLKQRAAAVQRMIATQLASSSTAQLSLRSRFIQALNTLAAKLGLSSQPAPVAQPQLDPRLRHARHLVNLAVRMLALHQKQEALVAAQAAVDLYVEIKNERSGDFPIALPNALNVLSNSLMVASRLEEALAAAQDAIVLERHVVAQTSERSPLYLGVFLLAISNVLLLLDRYEEALAAAQEAVTLYRDLVVQRLGTSRFILAGGLIMVARYLGKLDRHEEALAAAQEAVTIRRDLSAQRSEIFRPELALALITVAEHLGKLDRHEEALAAAQEAVTIRRDLSAQRHPDSHPNHLAEALVTLGKCLGKLDRHEEALAAAQEAVTLYRYLQPQHHPDFHPNHLAEALVTLGKCLGKLDRHEEALAAAQEAVTIRRDLSAQRSEIFRPELALALITVAEHLGKLDRHEEALAAAQEAVTIRRDLSAQRHPDSHPNHLAEALVTLGKCLGKLDRHEEALAAAQEAVTIRHNRVA